jgi:6-phosphogluconolactonase
MHRHLALLLSLSSLSACCGSAMPHYDLLVGTYTQGSSLGIYRYRFDSASGQIDPQPRQVLPSANPSWLVLSADQRHLLVTNETAPQGRVSSFAIDPHSATLTPLSQADSGGAQPTHASLSSDERYLFVANYAAEPDSGASVTVLPIGADGRIGALTQRWQHPASGVDAQRQVSSHMHSVRPSPEGRYLFASDLGGDRVYAYRYDAQVAEQPLTPATPAFTTLPPGSGPRHLLFSADGRHAYLTLELSNQLARFDYHAGVLELRQIVELHGPSEPATQQRAGALHLSNDGGFLYVASRGDDNLLVVFAVAPTSGALREIQRRAIEGKEPREFVIDPSGRYLLVANQLSDQLQVLRRDPIRGTLGQTVQTLPLSTPADLKFLRRR